MLESPYAHDYILHVTIVFMDERRQLSKTRSILDQMVDNLLHGIHHPVICLSECFKLLDRVDICEHLLEVSIRNLRIFSFLFDILFGAKNAVTISFTFQMVNGIQRRIIL